jgi:DNA (cytosine-5)-methyltransferase 1
MIPVIDLFAGPGGLNEGFSSVSDENGNPVFKTVASFEMEENACDTLVLRTALRMMRQEGMFPKDYYRFLQGLVTWADFEAIPEVSHALAIARTEVHQIELGLDAEGHSTRPRSDQLIKKALAAHRADDRSPWVLIGGPPCQAYSVAGRSRRTNDKDFAQDKKHFLFREYLRILTKFQPAIFVMENVTGLLSSTHGGDRIFDLILGDLAKPKSGPGYEIRSLVVEGTGDDLRPEDFVIRAEKYGIPQRRHRVILLGVRRDLAPDIPHKILTPSKQISLRTAIADLPVLRSRISPVRDDDWDSWAGIRDRAHGFTDSELGGSTRALGGPFSEGSRFVSDYTAPKPATGYEHWTLDENIEGITLHEARAHMAGDLLRYGFLSRMAEVRERISRLKDLPCDLTPAHKNVSRADPPFKDRFRVQLWDEPATTIVSHISKDGHYYIHPDSEQMRSLTVREAARLQSFPDNYFFMGSRTRQYHQVGNAVPPLLAAQIAANVARSLGVDISAEPWLPNQTV